MRKPLDIILAAVFAFVAGSPARASAQLTEPQWPQPFPTPGMEWTAPHVYGPPPDEPWLSTARCYGLAKRIVHDKAAPLGGTEKLWKIEDWLKRADLDYEKMVRARIAVNRSLPAGPAEIVAAVDAGFVYADTKLWGGKGPELLNGILDNCVKTGKFKLLSPP
jgi:hypothetical protein